MEELKVINEEVEIIDNDDEKETPNLLDLLLSADLKKFKVKSQNVEIPRLSEATGSPFVVELKQIPLNLEEDIEDRYNKINYNSDGEVEVDFKTMESRKTLLVECTYVGDKQLFKQSTIMKKFNAKTPNHLVEKLLTKGEISKLYNIYREVVGFNKDSVKEIKN